MACNCKNTVTDNWEVLRNFMQTRELPSNAHDMEACGAAPGGHQHKCGDCTCNEPIQELPELDKRNKTLNPSTFSVDLSILKDDHGIPRECSQEELSKLIEETDLFKGPQVLVDDEDPFVIAMKALLVATKNDLKSAEIMLSHMSTYIQKAKVDLDNERLHKKKQIQTLTKDKIVVIDSAVFEDLVASNKITITNNNVVQPYDTTRELRIRIK